MQQHSDKIDELIQQMKKQFIRIRQDYQHQLQEIESEFLEERRLLLKQNEDDIKALFDEH